MRITVPEPAFQASLVVLLFCIALLNASDAMAWGQEGHKTVALIAEHFLDPAVKERVDTILAADPDDLAEHDIASEAIWADLYRDSDQNTTHERYDRTEKWHYIPIQIDNPDIKAACYGRPKLPANMPASQGPANDCIIDKIDEFAVELAATQTSSRERLLALKFLLHFLGDFHQPLHVGEHHDEGGGQVNVSAAEFPDGTLHHFWDSEFIKRFGTDPRQVADVLISRITPRQEHKWAQGTTVDWAREAYTLSKDHAYGRLGQAGSGGRFELDNSYVEDATRVVATQLSRAGVRLAMILNRALRADPVSTSPEAK